MTDPFIYDISENPELEKDKIIQVTQEISIPSREISVPSGRSHRPGETPMNIKIGPLGQEIVFGKKRRKTKTITAPAEVSIPRKIKKVKPPKKPKKPTKFKKGDTVLVKVQKDSRVEGNLALVDGHFYVLTKKDKEVLSIDPRDIKNMEKDVLTKKIKIHYKYVVYRNAIILGKGYKVKLDDQTILEKVPEEDIFKFTEVSLTLPITMNLRQYLVNNFIALLERYITKNFIPALSVEKKISWDDYYNGEFQKWLYVKIYAETKHGLSPDYIRKLRENIKHDRNIPDNQKVMVYDRTIDQIIRHQISDQEEMLFDPQLVEEDRREFDNQYANELKRIHDSLPDPIELNKKKISQEIKEQVREYEKYIYDVSGARNYVSEFLFPYLFLSEMSPIRKYCQFFHEKLRSGAIKIIDIPNMKLLEFIPELFMSQKVLKKGKKSKFEDYATIEKVYKYLGVLQTFIVNYFERDYINRYLDETYKKEEEVKIPQYDGNLEDVFADIYEFCREYDISDIKICLNKDNKFVCELL